MRFLLALSLLAASHANAQNVSALVGALRQLGLTSLATTATTIANTSTGQQLLEFITSGAPVTVFAPDNNAFSGVPQNVTSNVTFLADTLAYHVLPGNFSLDAFHNDSNTIAKTLLNASDLVHLGPGDQKQVIGTRLVNGRVNILNQNTEATVTNTITQGNITVHVVDAVIDLPGPLGWAIDGENLTSFRDAINTANLQAINTAPGLTIFAPTNEAFGLVNTTGLNSSALSTVLQNHVINGSVIYSPLLAQTSPSTTAAGEPITFVTNSSGSFLTTGNASAHIIKSDIILQTGVLHIIDRVLLNTESNSTNAADAFNNATSSVASAASSTATAPLGTTAPNSGSSSGNNGGTNGAGVVRVGAMVFVGALVGSVAVLL